MSDPDFIPVAKRPEASMIASIGDSDELGTQASSGASDRAALNKEITRLATSSDPKLRAQTQSLMAERDKQDAVSDPDFIPTAAKAPDPDFIPAAKQPGIADALQNYTPTDGILGSMYEAGSRTVDQAQAFGEQLRKNPVDTLRGAGAGLLGMVPGIGGLLQGADPNYIANYIAKNGHAPSFTDLQKDAEASGKTTTNFALAPDDPSAGVLVAKQPAVQAGIEGPSAPFNMASVPGDVLTKAGYPETGAAANIATTLGMLAGGGEAKVKPDTPEMISAKAVLAANLGKMTETAPIKPPPGPAPISPEWAKLKSGDQGELPFSSDITQGKQGDLFGLNDLPPKEPIPPEVIEKVFTGVKADTIAQQMQLTKDLIQAETEDTYRKRYGTDISPEDKAKQMDMMFSFNALDKSIDALEANRAKQQLVDYSAEEASPTAMADAFQRAMKNQRGAIDPDLLGVGAMADFVQGLGTKFKTLREKIGALTDKYKGTFDGQEINDLKFESGDPNGKVTTSFMSPTDFHKLASVRDEGYTSDSSARRQSIAEALKTVAGLDEVPKLKIATMRDGTQRVIDHDGRHRMDELMRQGMTAVPVRLEHMDRSWNEDLNNGKPTPDILFSQDGTPQPHPKVFNLSRSAAEQVAIDNTNRRSMTSDMGVPLTRMPEGFQGVGNRQGGMLNLKAWFDPGKANNDLKNIDMSAFGVSKTQAIYGRMSLKGVDFVSAFAKTFGKDTLENFDLWNMEHGKVKAKFKNERAFDINMQDFGGITTSSFRAKNRFISEFGRLGNLVLSYFDDQLHLHKEEEHGLSQANATGFRPYEKYYGLGEAPLVNKVGLGPKFKLDQYKADIAKVLKMESDPSTWFNGKDYYPTVDQMVQHGLSKEAAEVWHGVHQIFDRTWGTLSKAANYAGVHMPERVPGYVPHIFKGPYRVVIRDISDPNNPSYLKEYNYFSESAAKKMLENNKGVIDGHPELTISLEYPKLMGKQTSQLVNGLWEAKSLMDRNAGLTKLLESIYDGSVRGIVSSVLDRAQLTKAGHILSRINEPGELGLKRSQILEASKMLRTVAEDVNGWYVRTKFVSDVLHPLDAAGLLAPERIQHAAKNYMESFFKIPDKFVPDIDWILRDDPWRSGLDPALFTNWAKLTRSGFAKYYLVGKVPFYTTNALQFTIGMPVMHAIKAFGLAAGEKTGSILMGYKDLILNKDSDRLTQYAVEHGHADPGFMEQMDPSSFRDPISVAIERATRLTAFKMGYHYFKQIMDDKGALEAAGNFSNIVSVPYDPDVGAPIFMNRMPNAIKPFILFASYNAHMISLASQTIRVTSLSLGAKNPAAFVHAATAMVGLQAMNMGLYGITGIVGMGNYNDIVKEINEKFGANLPDSHVIGRQIAKWAGSEGDLLAYGALSKYLGYDISSSGQGATFSTPLAGLAAFQLLGQAAILALRWGGSKLDATVAPSAKEMWDWGKGLSSQYRGAVEYALKDPNFKTTMQKVMGEVKDYSIGQDSKGGQDINLKGQERTKGQMIAHLFFGLTPNAESDTKTTDFNIKTQKAEEEFDISKTMQLVKEGNMSPKAQTEAIVRLSQKWWQDPGKFITELVDYRMNQAMTDEQRKTMEGARGDLNSMRWYLQWKEQQGLEPQRRLNGTK